MLLNAMSLKRTAPMLRRNHYFVHPYKLSFLVKFRDLRWLRSLIVDSFCYRQPQQKYNRTEQSHFIDLIDLISATRFVVLPGKLLVRAFAREAPSGTLRSEAIVIVVITSSLSISTTCLIDLLKICTTKSESKLFRYCL